MAERRIEVVLSAADDYSAALNRFNAAMSASGIAVESTGQSTDKLSKKLASLTDANDWAATGVKKFKNILEGIAFGGVIGAVSALTSHFIEQYRETERTQAEMDKLNTTIFAQAERWKLLPEPMNAVTKATVDIYNSQLALWKLDNLDRGSAIQKELDLLNKGINMRLAAMDKMSAIDEKTGQFMGGALALDVLEKHNREIVESRKKVAELTQEYEKWTTGMQLTEQTAGSLQSALETTFKAGDFTGGAFTEGSLSSLIAGSLKMPDAQFAVAGLDFASKLTAGIQAGFASAPALDIMSAITTTDSGDNTAYFAWLDERYNYERSIEEANLAAHLEYSNQYLAAEQNTNNTIMAMKFGAANQSIALLAVVGQKSKALQMAALVAQKALAMAQVWIQTQTAASAALAPPPLGLGPVFGAPLAASIQFWGKAQMGLIAATGLAEAAMGGAGNAPSGVGGGGGVGALPIAPPNISSEQKGTQHITVNIHALDPSSVVMDRIVEDNIVPALERLSGENGRNVVMDIQIKGR